MSRYAVHLTESRRMSYVLDATDREQAQQKVGELWCADAEPFDVDGFEMSIDFVDDADAWLDD